MLSEVLSILSVMTWLSVLVGCVYDFWRWLTHNRITINGMNSVSTKYEVIYTSHSIDGFVMMSLVQVKIMRLQTVTCSISSMSWILPILRRRPPYCIILISWSYVHSEKILNGSSVAMHSKSPIMIAVVFFQSL